MKTRSYLLKDEIVQKADESEAGCAHIRGNLPPEDA